MSDIPIQELVKATRILENEYNITLKISQAEYARVDSSIKDEYQRYKASNKAFFDWAHMEDACTDIQYGDPKLQSEAYDLAQQVFQARTTANWNLLRRLSVRDNPARK